MNEKVEMWTRGFHCSGAAACVLDVWGSHQEWPGQLRWTWSPPRLGFPRPPALREVEHSHQLSGSKFRNRVVSHYGQIQTHSSSGRAAWRCRWLQHCQPLSNELLSGGLAASPCFSFNLTLLKRSSAEPSPEVVVMLFWLAVSSCFQNSQFVTKENEQCPLKQFEVCHDGL